MIGWRGINEGSRGQMKLGGMHRGTLVRVFERESRLLGLAEYSTARQLR